MTVGAAIGSPSAAQSATGDDGDRPRMVFTDRVEVQWTLIPTVVRESGQLVEGLDVSDFELRIDGTPVPIETFEARTDAPASVVFLQDLSGSMRLLDKLQTSRFVLFRLLGSALGGDEFAMVTFAGARVDVAVPFTQQLDQILAGSESWRAADTTGLYDAIAWLPDVSLDGRQARRAAVVLTDGVDNASQLGAAEARQHVLRTQLPVYVIDLSHYGRFAPEQDRERPGASPPLPDDDPARPLELLATGTGGRYFRPLTRSQLVRATSEISRELRQQYVLGFEADSSRQASTHRVEVRVDRRVGEARHRPEYHGPPPHKQRLSGPHDP